MALRLQSWPVCRIRSSSGQRLCWLIWNPPCRKIELHAVAEEPEDVPQITIDSLSGDAVAERLRALQVDTMTPIEALNALYELKKLV